MFNATQVEKTWAVYCVEKHEGETVIGIFAKASDAASFAYHCNQQYENDIYSFISEEHDLYNSPGPAIERYTPPWLTA